MIGIAMLHVRHSLRDPSVSFLVAEDDGSWIRDPEPFQPMGRAADTELRLFRQRFSVTQVPNRAVLRIRAFRSAIVQVDDQTVGTQWSDPHSWRNPIEIEIAPYLRSGSGVLQIAVLNDNAHACVAASCDELGITTGSSWESSADGNHWRAAATVDSPEDTSLGLGTPSVAAAFGSLSGWLLLMWVAAMAWMFARARGLFSGLACTPSRVRWILIAAWIILGANDIHRLPLTQGFDQSAHLDYVSYILEHGKLPLANEGWEMYQAPLAYVLMAGLHVVSNALSIPSIEHVLRVIPLACGLLQIQFTYCTVRHALKNREDLQCIALWVAGLLPMNLYVAQVIGNEPLAGVTTAFVTLLCVKALCRESDEKPLREAAWIGLALGVALLSKVTAILWIPLIGGVIVASALMRGQRLRAGLTRTLVAWSMTVLVSGWFYVRNWIELGQPFVGNWDAEEANRTWWQDPSYRIVEHFTRFGRSLEQPIYAAADGFWDSLYSTMWTDGLLSGSRVPPPWNLNWMLIGAWIGAPITIAILIGMCRSAFLSKRIPRSTILASAAALLYVIVALDHYLHLPIYSCAKATYFLGLAPCIALLAAVGFEPMLRNAWTRVPVQGFIVCAGIVFFAAYFVV